MPTKDALNTKSHVLFHYCIRKAMENTVAHTYKHKQRRRERERDAHTHTHTHLDRQTDIK